MNSLLKSVLLVSLVFQLFHHGCSELPTLYEYYTKGGIKSGLVAEGDSFKLNGKEFKILGGSIHYFRVHPELWKDRLLKMKAAGLNAVQFYSAWNLHEEYPENFSFEGMLDLDRFLKEIKEADMFAVWRPGPYLCAEFEMGGLPSWLLRDPHLRTRTNYGPYLNATERYFKKLISIGKNHQFKDGGPIIAVQVENEYGGGGNTQKKDDFEYMSFLKNMITNFGIHELLFTNDMSYGSTKDHGSLPDMFKSVDFKDNPEKELKDLKALQPNKPLYVSEFWSGWFDQWGEHHNTWPTSSFVKNLQTILNMNSSVNFYMFLGGTNFGFTNGGVGDRKICTSYDYDAPLTEAGDYHEKYWKVKQIIEDLQKTGKIPEIKLPTPPPTSQKGKYGLVNVTHHLSLNDMLHFVKPLELKDPVPMELLNITEHRGQSFGFILYRSVIPIIEKLQLPDGVEDRALIIIDNKTVALQEIAAKDRHPTFHFSSSNFSQHVKDHVLDILVENAGRVSGGGPMNWARKGVIGKVLTDDKIHQNWEVFPLEFKQNYVEMLKNATWKQFDSHDTPAMFKADLQVNDKPKDTFLKMTNWTKGVAFVNGFNIGRYWNLGPQRTLYVPAPLLKTGHNDIYLFELHSAGNTIEFVDNPIFN